MRRRQLQESPARTHSSLIVSSPLFSQAACERVGVHIRLRTDTIDFNGSSTVPGSTFHFLRYEKKKKKTFLTFSKYSPNFPQKWRGTWETVVNQAAKALRMFKSSLFVSVPHRWQAKSPTAFPTSQQSG